MPTFQNYEICPVVFEDVEPENAIYKAHCRCAVYNPNTGEWLSKFTPAPIRKCDRAYGIVLEEFKTKFQPDMAELQEWYREETSRSDKRVKLFKKLKKKHNKK